MLAEAIDLSLAKSYVFLSTPIQMLTVLRLGNNNERTQSETNSLVTTSLEATNLKGRNGIRVEVSRQLGLKVREQGRKRKSLSASVSDSEKLETEHDINSTGTYKNGTVDPYHKPEASTNQLAGEDVLSNTDEDVLVENEYDVFEPLSNKEIEEHSFWKAYKAMVDGSKRKLHCSRKLVEDVIYAFVNSTERSLYGTVLVQPPLGPYFRLRLAVNRDGVTAW
ncbi:hypothetical protein BDR22DRAFT_825736 [Usnea florida]